jgi:hypothetical protein
MVVYPDKAHGVTGEPAQQLASETAKFFEESLK